MKTSRYSDSQILSILKQAENGIAVPELCREHGMSSATFYKWRAKYGGMDASLMVRMKELEEDYSGNTLPASSRSVASSIGLLLATTHRSSPRSRRLPAEVANPAACSAWVNVFSVKPVLCAM